MQRNQLINMEKATQYLDSGEISQVEFDILNNISEYDKHCACGHIANKAIEMSIPMLFCVNDDELFKMWNKQTIRMFTNIRGYVRNPIL